jgi:hypothetical protein
MYSVKSFSVSQTLFKLHAIGGVSGCKLSWFPTNVQHSQLCSNKSASYLEWLERFSWRIWKHEFDVERRYQLNERLLIPNQCEKLTSLKLVLRTTIMTPVKPQISKFKADKCPAKWALTCYGGFTHERLLSESSRPYMLAYILSSFIDCTSFLISCLEEKT